MGTHIERLLSELESGSDDDRSVAHSCRVELEARERSNAELLHKLEHARGALEEMLALGETYLKETGGCDHSVNICVCDIKGAIENTRAALAKLTTTEAKK